MATTRNDTDQQYFFPDGTLNKDAFVQLALELSEKLKRNGTPRIRRQVCKSALYKSIYTQVTEEPSFNTISSQENNQKGVVHDLRAPPVTEMNVKAELREVLRAQIMSDGAEVELNETAELGSDFDVCFKRVNLF